MVAKMEKEEKERKKTHTYTALLRSETYHVIKYTGAFAVTRDFEKCTDLNVQGPLRDRRRLGEKHDRPEFTNAHRQL